MEPDDQATNKPGANVDDDRNKKGQFVPGHSHRFDKDNQPANHPGRPKSKTLTDALLRHLEKKADRFAFTKKAARAMDMNPAEVTVIEVLMASSLLHGVKGKGDILKEMWARVEGSIPKTLNLGPTDEFGAYLDAMRDKTQFDPVGEPEETPDADA